MSRITGESSANGGGPPVQKLSLVVSEQAVVEGATEILKVIRPDWCRDNVRFKLFTDGITNKLVGCFKQPSEGTDTAETPEPEDVVLIRVYGNKTDLLIDRRKETENIQLLHRHGYAPALYATFANGLAYQYVPGVTLTPDTCQNDAVWPLVARRMAQMHRVQPDGPTNPKPDLPAKLDQFLRLVPDRFTDPHKDERVWKVFPSVAQLRNEFEELYGRLLATDSPVVFCHNDLLLGNVIYDERNARVTFIDYEYAGPNHQAFDIGNHFTEFAGIDEIDYGRYPTPEFQRRWLRVYLQEYGKGTPVTDVAVQRLYVQVNQYALASHFLWSIWALIQAEHSTIDFDFVQFGATRFLEYRQRKDNFLALRCDDD
ncbi:AGAP000010-PA [Anopheles gambiae str. PEST]|uniref:ethanolamine kinase n=2 Tax=gambiae species complex TaxID=44542 RepID=Q7QEI8_ANOGA|nr:AGAP000010-PA [Anopheles gambiae str. PEST]